jgi:CRISPR/Cas system-associated exonuclease Cas4 (RecB family)/cold shock CspA family protein
MHEFTDYGSVEWFDDKKGYGLVISASNDSIFIHRNEKITGTLKKGKMVLIGKIKTDPNSGKKIGQNIVEWTSDQSTLFYFLFDHWSKSIKGGSNFGFSWLLFSLKIYTNQAKSRILFRAWKNTELRFDEIANWLIQHSHEEIFKELIEINYDKWLKDKDFIVEVKKKIPRPYILPNKGFNPISCQEFIFDVWSKEKIKVCDDNIRWLILYAKNEILAKVIDINKENWKNDQEFILKIRNRKIEPFCSEVAQFLIDIWASKPTKEYDENINHVIRYSDEHYFNQVIKIAEKHWKKDQNFIDSMIRILEDRTNLTFSYTKIGIIEDFLFDTWFLQSAKKHDRIIECLIKNAREEVAEKIIKANKPEWLKNNQFINSLMNCNKTNEVNLFLLEVWAETRNVIYLSYLIDTNDIQIIKKIIGIKTGSTIDFIDKIYAALFPLNRLEYYREKAKENDWPDSFKEKYIFENELKATKKLIDTFSLTNETPYVSMSLKVVTKKETHAATDLANFAFCPASYALSQTYNLDFSEQENINIGEAEHQNQRFLNLRDIVSQRSVPFTSSETVFNRLVSRIIHAKSILAGHDNSSIQSKIYYSKNRKISGIPDYIFRDEKGHFAVEEKYTFKKPDELEGLFKNHKVQALAYLYGLSDFEFTEVYVCYWFVEKCTDSYLVTGSKAFELKKSNEHKQILLDVFNNVEAIQNRQPYAFSSNQINYKKCVRCSYFPYCDYKSGEKKFIELPAIQPDSKQK